MDPEPVIPALRGHHHSSSGSSTTASRSVSRRTSTASSPTTTSESLPPPPPVSLGEKMKGVPIAGSRKASVGGAAAICGGSEGMSESYHEIFDTLMPPETAKAKIQSENVQTPDRLADAPSIQPATSSILPDGTSGGTNYLTTKLVEDSLRWQEKHPGYTKADTPSPFSSPVRRPHRTRPLMHEGASAGVLQRPTPPLDPHCLLELERSAKLLASSVDEMTEQLSTVLHDISSVTVETMETYRDGVCKTCDAVDTNIKTMYQVMAKVEELNKSMGPAYRIAEEVKDIKRVLDILEANFK